MLISRTGVLKDINQSGFEYEGVTLLSNDNKVITLAELIPDHSYSFTIYYFESEEELNKNKMVVKESKYKDYYIIILGDGKTQSNVYIDNSNSFKNSFKIEDKMKIIKFD